MIRCAINSDTAADLCSMGKLSFEYPSCETCVAVETAAVVQQVIRLLRRKALLKEGRRQEAGRALGGWDYLPLYGPQREFCSRCGISRGDLEADRS